ncbi:unnamed protein product, partial [Coccothraustes coccothraustes]
MESCHEVQKDHKMPWILLLLRGKQISSEEKKSKLPLSCRFPPVVFILNRHCHLASLE